MNQNVRNRLLYLAASCALILSFLAFRPLTPLGLTHEQLLEIGYFSFEEPTKIDDFKLVTHLNEELSLNLLKGQWVVIFFGYTSCPDICPTTLSVLNHSLQDSSALPAIEPSANLPADLGSNAPGPKTSVFKVVMVTVDPQRDTTDRLAAYVPAFNPSFVGVTGEADEISLFARQLHIGFTPTDAIISGDYLVDHSSSLPVLNPMGDYAGFLKYPLKPENIKKVFQALIQGQVRNPGTK